MDIQNDELKEYVKEYLKENLSINVDAYEGSSGWEHYTNIRVSVYLELEGEQISWSDSSFNLSKG